MLMWTRLGGAMLVTAAVVACLEYFSTGALSSGRSGNQIQETAPGRVGELFWFLVFAAVMATALLAAARRCAGHLGRLARTPALKRRDSR